MNTVEKDYDQLIFYGYKLMNTVEKDYHLQDDYIGIGKWRLETWNP